MSIFNKKVFLDSWNVSNNRKDGIEIPFKYDIIRVEDERSIYTLYWYDLPRQIRFAITSKLLDRKAILDEATYSAQHNKRGKYIGNRLDTDERIQKFFWATWTAAINDVVEKFDNCEIDILTILSKKELAKYGFVVKKN